MIRRGHNTRCTRWSVVLGISLVAFLLAASAQAAPTAVPLLGEIERITIDNPADNYSGGTIVVGGQIVILPRNLLLDLPANRLTLKQLFDQAPAACVANGESGIAKADACNTSGAGGFAMLSANRSDFGNVIAGDVFLQKGQESVSGTVTFINFNDGYYRLNGQPGVDNAGVIVRLNDPGAKHTIQTGLGCLSGSQNCSADPRFTLDPDNYTNSFSNGYPYCLPSTVPRPFAGLPAITGVASLPAGTAKAGPAGDNDVLCPQTNRPAGLNLPAADSRRFAPLKATDGVTVGDTVTADGNFETIAGATFLSAHTSSVGVALPSAITAGHPDYFTLAEVFMDAPAWYNQRYRTLIIGYTTLADPAAGGTDVLFWTIHRDKVNNAIHEVPWTSVQGCDNAAGVGSCSSQGLVGAGGNIFRIRHDIDFLLADPNAAGACVNCNPLRYGAAKDSLSLCAMLRGEPRFGNPSPFCPNAVTQALVDGGTIPSLGNKNVGTGSLAEEFGVFSPIPHEIIARTGRKVADVAGAIKSMDVSGNEAAWGTYLFPFGVNLGGGISLQEFNEIDLNLISTPNLFEGIPWNLDRRLGPGGCPGDPPVCPPDTGNPYEYALSPFPYSGLHPATALANLVGAVAGVAGGLPTGPYNDPNFTASPLSNVQNRIFSFVDNTLGIFNGNLTLLDNTLGAALIPPAFPITPTPPLPAPPPPPATSATLTAGSVSPQNVGASILFTAGAAGGTGLYEFRFVGRQTGTTPIFEAQPYGPLNTWTWVTTAVAPGIYEFQVYARSAGSIAPAEAISPPVIFTMGVPPVDNVSLTPNLASPRDVGTSVVFTATALGGTAPAQYQFWYRSVGSPTFSMAQDYGAANAYTWGTTAGSYEWKVFARSAGSTAVSEAVSPIVPFVVNPPPGPAPAGSVTLTPSLASPQQVGASITFTAAASGGSGTYQYQFWGRAVGATTFSLAQDYGPSNTFTWNTGTVPVGDYEWQVYARNAGSTAALEAISAPLRYVITVAPTATVVLTTSLPSPQTVGASIVFTGAATGGSGTFEYRFEGRVVGAPTWALAQDYTLANTWTWNTATVAAGNYEFRVLARSAGSNLAVEATSLPVGYVLNPLPATSGVTLSADLTSPQTAGSIIVLTATPSGGSGTYQYQFWGRAIGATTFSLAQDYGPGNTFTWNTGGVPAGSYEWIVFARNAQPISPNEAISAPLGFVLQ